MYIRRTQTRNNATGEPYFTYRLVRSERIDGKVKQVTLLNLGRHFAVDQSLWPALCIRIDELLAGQASLVEINLPKSAAVEADRIAAQLQLHMAPVVSATATPAQSETELEAKSEAVPTTDVQAVDVNTLELVRPRSVGVEHIGLWAMRQVEFAELLRELGLSSPMRAAILGVIIERTLFNRVHDLLGLNITVTRYDLTNTYFEGTAAANPKANHGRSKEKRSDCPLVTLGLVLDGSGPST